MAVKAEMDNPPAGGRHQRRRDLHCLLAAGFLFLALAAWGRGLRPVSAPAAPVLPPAVGAAYRPDGGQMLGPFGLTPNALSRLNLGRRLDLTQTRPELLAALPGLGGPSAAKAHESGCLNARQRKNIRGLVIERCNLNKP